MRLMHLGDGDGGEDGCNLQCKDGDDEDVDDGDDDINMIFVFVITHQ